MNRSFFLLVLILATSPFLTGCNLPRVKLIPQATGPTTAAVPPTETPPPPLPTAELGRAENPLILALSPSAHSPAQIDAAAIIAAQLTERTGYVVVTVIPDSEAALVDAFNRGNAHIAILDPFAYELAFQGGSVKAAFATVEEGKTWYGAQFIAPRREGFTSYFDPVNGANTVDDAGIAIAQFAGRKPCWSDAKSPSGYVIPFGYLKSIGIATRPAAFVEGQPSVVRALYAGGICDFGATYIDARKFPSLEDEYPDLIEQVEVIWRIPDIIPYNVLVFSSAMPQPMRNLFSTTLPAIHQTEAGNVALRTLYGINAIEPANDASFNEFRTYVLESGVELPGLVK